MQDYRRQNTELTRNFPSTPWAGSAFPDLKRGGQSERRNFRLPRRSDVSAYRQTLDFTCGAACLMNAMARLNPLYEACFQEEILIWREANTVFMGNGHPGTNAFGLGLSGLRRRRKVSVYGKNIASMFTCLNPVSEERQAQYLSTEHDHHTLIKEGGSVFEGEHATSDLLRSLVDRGDQVLVLVWLDEATGMPVHRASFEPHWILISGGGDRPDVLDPYDWGLAGLSSPDLSTWESISEAMMRGNPKGSAMVSLR